MDYIHPINCAIDYIESSLTQEIDLSKVAAAAGYSSFHLSRLFRAMTGETPAGYVRKRRLSEAARQLLTTKRRILDIALDHQFGSQAAFTRAFRAAFGISPGAYRKRGQFVRLTRRITLQQPRLCRVNGERAPSRQGAGRVVPARALGLYARRTTPLGPRRASDRLVLVFY
jgi:AraC-like DNA-binding protein